MCFTFDPFSTSVRRGDLYIVDFSANSQPAVCLLAKASEGWLWHRRIGHAGMRNLHTLPKKKHVIGIENVKFLKDHLCGACEAGKMTKAKHPAKTIMTTTRPFELLHMDLFGSLQTIFLEGFNQLWCED